MIIEDLEPKRGTFSQAVYLIHICFLYLSPCYVLVIFFFLSK